jgi:hypothetical protein
VGWINGGSSARDAGFCGPCMCLGVFLLFWWRVLMSGIAGGCDGVKLV